MQVTVLSSVYNASTHSVSHESEPFPSIIMTVPCRVDCESCASSDALWTDKALAAPSMRSHLEVVVDEDIIDLLSITYRDFKVFPLRNPAVIQRREALCRSCFTNALLLLPVS